MPPSTRKNTPAGEPGGTEADKPSGTVSGGVQDPAPDGNQTPEGAPGDVAPVADGQGSPEGDGEPDDGSAGYSSDNLYRTQWGLRTMGREHVDELRRLYPDHPIEPVESLRPGERPIDPETEARYTAEATAGERLGSDQKNPEA